MSSNNHYTHLLAQLHNPSPSLPLESVQAVLAHHLAHLNPYPTPLAAAAVSSPLFRNPYSLVRLQTVSAAFRHAFHIKFKLLNQPGSFTQSLFSLSVPTRARQWYSSVMKGLQGGPSLVRLAACQGLLFALDDLKTKIPIPTAYAKLEDETIVAFAEIMDLYAHDDTSWEQEWNKTFRSDNGEALSLALIIASQALVLVSPNKMCALPLGALARILTSTITTTFRSGTFLSSLQSSYSLNTDRRLEAEPNSSLAATIANLNAQPTMASMPSLSRILASTLHNHLEANPIQGLASSWDTLEALSEVAKTLELLWKDSDLARLHSDAELAPGTLELTKTIWTTLKTFMFVTVMVADSILSTSTYLSPTTYKDSPHIPPSLALITLHILSHLCFVVSQFGGLTTGSSASGEGFKELKKTFYLALDVLASSDAGSGESFVRQALQSVGSLSKQQHSFTLSKMSYVFACIEQLVPHLSSECIQDLVIPASDPYLFDATNREVFESAHSVMLAIFTDHAHTLDAHVILDHALDRSSFVPKLIPFYVSCLIENSLEGKLIGSQLQIAFGVLVRAAVAAAPSSSTETASQFGLAWFCIDALLDAARDEQDASRYSRFALMLVSSVSSVPLVLLPRTLDAVYESIKDDRVESSRQDIITALFAEVMEKVGDREKEYAMQWWLDHWDELKGLFSEDERTSKLEARL